MAETADAIEAEVGNAALYPSSERVSLKVPSFLDYLAKQHRKLFG
jgi:hypothetical protein